MTTICWTVIHNLPADTVHAARHFGHILHHVRRFAPHRVIPRPRSWAEFVCKVVVGGGGLLVPQPALPPPAPPVPIVQPAPPLATPWLIPSPGFFVPSVTPATIRGGGESGSQSAPEPSTAVLLGISAGAALLVRRHRRRR
jgi:hypothetical protein